MTIQPPQHSATTELTWVPSDVDAWDFERIDKETTEHRKEEPNWIHPAMMYLAEWTTWDINAKADPAPASEYVKEGAERWHFRPLGRTEYEACANLVARNLFASAQSHAFRIGVTAVDGLGIELEGPKTRGGQLTDSDMDKVHEKAAGRIYEVGEAILASSSGRLVSGEKKP